LNEATRVEKEGENDGASVEESDHVLISPFFGEMKARQAGGEIPHPVVDALLSNLSLHDNCGVR
jgi:hypothetical protein